MTAHRAPRSYDEVRPLYERAVFEGDKVRQATIELDVAINHGQEQFLHSTDPDLEAIITELNITSQEALKAPLDDLNANFTDINRLASIGSFRLEKMLMPILFGANTQRVQVIREIWADSTESKSVEIIETLLENLPDPFEGGRENDRDRVRGAIQEQTATALFNYRQDGQFIVLPASLEDDITNGIDLEAFYIAADGRGYKTPISIKSSRDNAQKEKRRHPHLVVLAAADFNNHDLSISRLLVRRDEGYPGINEIETVKLEAAQQAAYKEFCNQVNAGATAIELPRYPAQKVVRPFQATLKKIAV